MQKTAIINSVFSSVEFMPRLTLRRIPSSPEFSIWHILVQPSALNWAAGNEGSILVSEIKRISTLLCNISTIESNLLRSELMIRFAIINLLGFFNLKFSMFE